MDQNGRTAVPRSLSFQERREAAVRELLRLLRPGGQALIYVWALEQKGTQEDDGPSKYIKPVKNNFSQTCLPQDGQGDSGMPLPVHINRTDFEAHDMLVPWHSRDTGEVHYRYYHLFQEGELRALVEGVAPGVVQEEYLDQGNWCLRICKQSSGAS